MAVARRIAGKYKDEIRVTDYDIRSVVESEIKCLGVHADLNHILVDDVTDMSCLFRDLDFDGDISRWSVGEVTDMSYMFERSTFNGDISKWNVGNVKNHEGCFYGSPLQSQPVKQPKFIP